MSVNVLHATTESASPVVTQLRLLPQWAEPSRDTSSRDASSWVSSNNKRAFDLALALLLLIPVIVLIAAVAAVSAVAFRAEPLFKQHRVGLDGETFVVLKIRSLPATWAANVGKHDLVQHSMPRISKLIRGSHIDELPQLFNVLSGQMSFVGPRPMIQQVLDRLPQDVQRVRNAARPGITGPWQISTMGGVPLHECPDLDVYYVGGATCSSDMYLLWRTAVARVGGRPPEPRQLHARLEPVRTTTRPIVRPEFRRTDLVAVAVPSR